MDTRDIDLDEELEACLDTCRGLLGDGECADDLWEASDLANRALAIRPDSSEAWLVKGQVMSAIGDDVAALACIEKSLSIAPRDAETLYWHAAVLADLERFGDALASAELAFEALTDGEEWLLEELYYEKAVILESMGDPRAALATFQDGLARFPDSTALKAGLAPLQRERVRRSFKVIPGGLGRQ